MWFEKVLETKVTLPSKLDKETQELIKLIYDQDMFKSALKKFDIGKAAFIFLLLYVQSCSHYIRC